MRHTRGVAALQEMAAANNAVWCDLVCRSHGVPTSVDGEAWTSTARAPRFYPDAVTLVPDPSVANLLERVDTSAGCSVKDSFASIDLSGNGFRVLFDASWLARTPGAPRQTAPPAGWEVVRDADALGEWQCAWRGDDVPSDLFRPELLANDEVAVLAERKEGRIVAGAILTNAAEVVGISNVFTDPARSSMTWLDCVTVADTVFPGATLVGYETGGALAVAATAGFEAAGSLRVWIKEA